MSQVEDAFDKAFGFLYETRDYERAAFGEQWCGPSQMPREWTLVAKYEKKSEDGDGQSVEVYCSAMPARFYKLKVLAGHNSVNAEKRAYEVTTGSGEHKLIAHIAKAISEGMLGFNPPETIHLPSPPP